MANTLGNPSFETNTTGWNATSSGSTITRTVSDAYDGLACGIHSRDSGSGNAAVTTDPKSAFVAVEGQAWSAGAYLKANGGTARQVRCDIRFFSAAEADIGGANGFGGELTPDGTWQRIFLENVTAPAATAYVSMRFVMLSAAAGDSYLVDAAQLELGATLPAYNPVYVAPAIGGWQLGSIAM